MSIYTAGIPARIRTEMGGVVEVNTLKDSDRLHGQVVLYGGSFDSGGALAKGQYTWGKDTLGASGDGSRTDHYLNPVVPETTRTPERLATSPSITGANLAPAIGSA